MTLKKILVSVLAMMSFSFGFMNAQTVMDSKFTDNTYISVTTGATGWLHPNCNGYSNFGKSISSVSGLRLGKYVTPILGFEIEGEVGMANRYTFVDHTLLNTNMLFNMNNVFHNYKEIPDLVEFVPFLGFGWHHTYGHVNNNLSSKFGMQVNFNLGKEKAWQINVIPSINYIMTDNGFSNRPTAQPRYDICRSYVNLQVGFTYKFKNQYGTHHFVISPYKYTQSYIDTLNGKINEQLRMMTEKDSVIQTQNDTINMLNTRLANNSSKRIENLPITIGFKIGSSKIDETQLANLITIADYAKNSNDSILIIGYADKKTGSSKRNYELGELRANSVKNALIDMGVKKELISTKSMGSSEQLFNINNANRAAIFIKK